MIKEDYNQEFVNSVWEKVWQESNSSPKNIFKNHLFFEAWKVIEKYIPSDSKIILEAGGGGGRFGLKIAEELNNSQIIIIDIVDSALDLIKRTADKMRLNNVSILKDDVLKLSFPDNYFDVIISDAVIQHVSDDARAVKEMARVLKPGGILIVSVVNFWNFHMLYKKWLNLIGRQYEYKSERSYRKSDLRKLFEKQQIKIIAEDGFYPAYGILRLKKYNKIFKFIGRICNRIVKFLDKITNRFFSKNFGFEIVIIGKKSF
ncbi:MAG: class I SAM-dependent methyltransferase [bacterium]